MIHYIYKIIFLRGYPAGRYYLGKRSYRGNDLNNDTYTGSGNFCFAYFKKYGAVFGDTYLKEIIEINPSMKVNAAREAIIIGNKYKTDPLCMNQMPGGYGGEKGNYILPPINQYDLDGNFIKEWESIISAANELHLSAANIKTVCNKKRYSCGGFLWTFKGDTLPEIKNNYTPGPKEVCLYDKSLKLIAKYKSIEDASKNTGIKSKQIWKFCQNTPHYKKDLIWCYADRIPALGISKGLEIDQYSLNGDFIKHYVSIHAASVENKINASNLRKHCNNGKPYKNFIWKYTS